jgi:hypothetical protein
VWRKLVRGNWKVGHPQCQDGGARTTEYIQTTKLDTMGSNLPVEALQPHV